MIGFYISHIIKHTYKSQFWRENVKMFPSFTRRYNERHCVTLLNLLTISCLSILFHGVISLPVTTSCDDKLLKHDTRTQANTHTIVKHAQSIAKSLLINMMTSNPEMTQQTTTHLQD